MIKNEKQYQKALEEVDKLVDEIVAYEDIHYPIDEPDMKDSEKNGG